MSMVLLIIAAAAVAAVLLGGLLWASFRMTARKEASGKESWADNGSYGGGPEGANFLDGCDAGGGGGD